MILHQMIITIISHLYFSDGLAALPKQLRIAIQPNTKYVVIPTHLTHKRNLSIDFPKKNEFLSFTRPFYFNRFSHIYTFMGNEEEALRYLGFTLRAGEER